MNAEKLPYFGCKVSQSVQIVMKLKVNLCRPLLYVYIMFQIVMSKHVEKKQENFEKSKTHKNNRQNFENKIF